VIGALILGLFAGFIGRAILPGKQSMSLLMTVVLGLAGAALGWLIFTKLIGIGDDDAFDLGGLPGAIVGAVILLWGYDRVVSNRSAVAAVPARGERERGEARQQRGEARRDRGGRDRPEGRGEREGGPGRRDHERGGGPGAA
jgi:uncharacterized membrane protein YeaQ/YmgE (transglycosylase-associated protein family)